MVNCPECGKPLMKGSQSKYYCEKESCPVIYVQCPYASEKRRIAYTSLATEERIEKIEKGTAKNRSYVF